MSIISSIKGLVEMVLKKYVKDEFQINPIVSTEMEKVFNISSEIYSGYPKWVTDDVKTINFAKAVCSETERLKWLLFQNSIYHMVI